MRRGRQQFELTRGSRLKIACSGVVGNGAQISRRQRVAVVPTGKTKHAATPGHRLGDSHGALVSFRAGGQKKNSVEIAWSDGRKALGCHEDVWRHILIAKVHKLLHLRFQTLAEFLMSIPQNAAELA